MQYLPLDSELALLQSMPAQQRLHYATTRMIECEEVWSLGDDSGWLIRDVDGRQVIPIWPYRQLAMEYVGGESAALTPQATSLENFVYAVLDMCETDDIWLEVYPKADDGGRLLSSSDLYQLLSGMMESAEYLLEG